MYNEPTPAPNKSNRTLWLVLGGVLLLLLCMACLCVIAVAGVILAVNMEDSSFQAPLTPTAVARVTDPPPPTRELLPDHDQPPATFTPEANNNTLSTITTPVPVPMPDLGLTPPDAIDQIQPVPEATADLDAFFAARYPYQDYYETAQRWGQYELDGRTVSTPDYKVGASRIFYTDEGELTATLAVRGEFVNFWVEEDLDLDIDELATAVTRLEEEFYPQLVTLFGQEWRPGIDNDPSFSVLHLAGDSNASELGYFSSIDEYPRTLYSDSNELEMIYMVMGNLNLGSELYYGTLVHEVQHMIQWHVDPNETAWLNEGLSQLAELYTGLDSVDTFDYMNRPDIQVNRWPDDDNLVDAHYAGAYLYAVYLWEQLGETAVQELSRHPANGMAAVHAILNGYDSRDLAQFSSDWAVANYLDDQTAGAAYYYRDLDPERPDHELRVSQLPVDTIENLAPFGVHYVQLRMRGPVTINFAGDTTVSLIDAPPPTGERFWLAPAQNDSHAYLTTEFDLTGVEQAQLQFNTWYDLEEDWDFAYLSISMDGGVTWEILKPDHSSAGEHGSAWNGRSDAEDDANNGWLKETISLNGYVGRVVQLRFDVLTDTAVTGRGFAVDDLRIEALNYVADGEQNDGGWQSEGFVRTRWQLPQQWAVQLIHEGPEPAVIPIPLNQLNQGQWIGEVSKGDSTLVIMPTTPFVTTTADYWLNIEEGEE